MSNNNPHGHISQPAQNPSSWNPLQIPSYIPRQPQLAHMSNERPMVRSPLAWHAPAPPPDSIYNFMSANHKNLDHQMNPLLPPYVRGPSPFDSMDLSVQSSRSTNSPLHKSGGQNSALPHDYAHKQQQQQQHSHQPQQQQQQNPQQQQQSQMHGSNNYPIHLPTSSPSTITHSHVVTHSHQQQQQQQQQTQHRQQSQHPHSNLNPHGMQQTGTSGGIGVPSNAKYLSSNGNDCDMLPPPLSAMGAGSTGGSGGSNSSSGSVPTDQSGRYMRENEVHMNENYAKMSNINRNFENESKSLQKPVELVSKDCNYTLLSNKVSHQQQVSPKKHSPIRNYHAHGQQQQPQYNSPHTMTHNGPHTPPTPQSPVSQQQQSSSSTPPSTANAIHQMNESRIIQDSNVMDYNQLHLQHNNNYGSHSHPHHQQQQSQQSSPHHNQDQHQQSHHMHFGSQVHLQQQQSHQHQASPPATLQQLSQHQSHQQPTSPHLTNLDSYTSHGGGKPTELDQEKSVITDLSTATPPAAHKRTQPANCFPARTESPGNATSNEDSVDSNSNSSRTRRKRKPNKIGRTSSNESEPENQASMHAMDLEPTLEGSLANEKKPTQNEDNAIKQQSPEQHKPSRNPDIQSPSSQERRSDLSAGSLHPELKSSPTVPNEGNGNLKKNGGNNRPATHKSQSESEVETIDKIAEMIAKTSSNEVHNSSNSNCSSRSGVGSIGSPKTKKQRQALKLRSAEQNSNSNCSTNSYSESLPGAANDNAVLAEELRKGDASPVEDDAATARQVKNDNNASAAIISRPLSPQSNSHSCSSSSSSSSSCSNSSHSSSGSKENKHKNDLESKSAAVEEHRLALEKQHILKTNVSGDAEAVSTKNEVLKTEEEQDTKNVIDGCMESKKEPMKSPAKSCFEEVENKLEEMFAGIEDEPPVAVEEENTLPPPPVHDSEVSKELSLALELSTPAAVNSSNVRLHAGPEAQTEQQPSHHPTPSLKPDKPPPTKAAKKSTMPSPVKTNVSTPTPTMPTRVVPPRRRMSVLMDPASLRIALDAENCMDMSQQLKTSGPAAVPIDEQPSTSAAAAAALAAASKPPNLVLETPSNEVKSSPKKKGGKANARKGTIKSKAKGGKGKPASKKQQQLQKHKKKPHEYDDFEAPAKESNGNHATEPKYKSPYILVKQDGSISVINAPTAEDVLEKQTKVKKTHHGYAHDRKNLRGMHSSTLSNKYDADTADKTWICVFCKRGPHRMGLGDLFGPYLVSTDCEEYKTAVRAPGSVDLDAVFVNKRRRVDMVQCNPRNLPVVPAGGVNSALATNRGGGGSSKKKKKSIDEPPPQSEALDTSAESAHESGNLLGMCKVSETSYEVWLHEDCAVWAPDVFLVGARVMGLNAAVWNSTRYNCVMCTKSGAMICCLQRGCSEAAHVPCARQAQWSLNESDFKIYCQKHASSSGSPAANSPSLLLLNRLTTSGSAARQS